MTRKCPNGITDDFPLKDYSEADDNDFVLSDESEEDDNSLEYESDAEVSNDDSDSSNAEDWSEDKTLLEEIMKEVKNPSVYYFSTWMILACWASKPGLS